MNFYLLLWFTIASIAFINTGKNRGFFKKSQCHYGFLLSDFFGPSCAPGALDLAHDPQGVLNSLCSLCRTNVTINGPAISAVHHSTPAPLLRVNGKSRILKMKKRKKER